MIEIPGGIQIPDEEIQFIASRSGGPGGQNVNKVSSRVTLLFDVEHSAALTADQRRRIRSRLATRINKEGVLRVTSQRTRSQDANRTDALERFIALMAEALKRRQPRIPTRVPQAAREHRLASKKKRTALKRDRSLKGLEE